MTTPTEITLEFRVTSITEAINGRIQVFLTQTDPTISDTTGNPAPYSPGSTAILLTPEVARNVFPGDLYTMTFAPTAPPA